MHLSRRGESRNASCPGSYPVVHGGVLLQAQNAPHVRVSCSRLIAASGQSIQTAPPLAPGCPVVLKFHLAQALPCCPVDWHSGLTSTDSWDASL